MSPGEPVNGEVVEDGSWLDPFLLSFRVIKSLYPNGYMVRSQERISLHEVDSSTVRVHQFGRSCLLRSL